MPNDFYGVAWIFIMYAFVGCCCEVIFAALCDGKFVNRGFLAGPVCPIYGFGVLIVVCVLNPIKDNIFVLFIGSVLLTSALEFAAGWALERFLHQKWWDYTDIPFNIKGYVCLKFSLLWGLACVFVVKLVHPTLFALVMKIPRIVGVILLSVFFAALVSDLTIAQTSRKASCNGGNRGGSAPSLGYNRIGTFRHDASRRSEEFRYKGTRRGSDKRKTRGA